MFSHLFRVTHMSLKLGVVMDPIESINYKKDTTLALLWAAQDRGWSLFYIEPDGLSLEDEVPMARSCPLRVHRDPSRWFEIDEAVTAPLSDLDIVLMRKDPPFDMEYIYSTYLLERAEREGTLVVNRCQSLRDCNEKLFATEFSDCCPPLLVSRSMAKLRGFHSQYNDVIFKPLDGMGGQAIFRAKPDDPNVSVILETLTEAGRKTIMAQQYLPEITEGDKRILLVNGEAVPYCLARVPLAGESRGTLPQAGPGGFSRLLSVINGSRLGWGRHSRSAASTLLASMSSVTFLPRLMSPAPPACGKLSQKPALISLASYSMACRSEAHLPDWL